MGIRSFRHKGLKRLYEADEARGLPAKLVPKLRDILAVLDTSDRIEDVGLFPGWRLHALKGDLLGYWRLIFQFREGEAFDIDLVDYH